jgi:hypothetical protein
MQARSTVTTRGHCNVNVVLPQVEEERFQTPLNSIAARMINAPEADAPVFRFQLCRQRSEINIFLFVKQLRMG